MDKPTHFDVPIDAYEYAPVAGITELREKVATLYNELYRKDKPSKYTAENVSGEYSGVILLLTFTSLLTGLHCSRVNVSCMNLGVDISKRRSSRNFFLLHSGRAGLTRVASTIADIQVGYFLPEVSLNQLQRTKYTKSTFILRKVYCV